MEILKDLKKKLEVHIDLENISNMYGTIVEDLQDVKTIKICGIFKNITNIETLIIDDEGVIKKLAKSESLIKNAISQGNGALYIIVQENSYLLQTKLFCYHCNTIMFNTTPAIFSSNDPEYMCQNCKGLDFESVVDINKLIIDENISILNGASKWWSGYRKFVKKPNSNWVKAEVLALANDMNVDLELSEELKNNYYMVQMEEK